MENNQLSPEFVEAKKKKILLIEDDTFISQMYTAKFKQTPHELLSVGDGEEGLALAKEENPEAILLDIVLPKVDGFKILEKLKADETTKNIPIILLSNLGQEANIQKGMSMGALDYIVKAHYTPQEVVERVEKILGGVGGSVHAPLPS